MNLTKCACEPPEPFKSDEYTVSCSKCGGWLYIRTTSLKEWDAVKVRFGIPPEQDAA